MKVVAAVGSNYRFPRALRVAIAVADVLGAEVEAIHAGKPGARRAQDQADEAQVAFRSLPAPAAKHIIERARARDVEAVVLGRPGISRTRFPFTGLTASVLASIERPVILVPRPVPSVYRIRRVLVPMQPDLGTATNLSRAIALAEGADLEIVVVHVRGRRSLPMFDDQPQHEMEAWAREFLDRWVGVSSERVSLHTRVGSPARQILSCARDVQADLIALGWARDPPARPRVTRAVVAGARVPVALVPVTTSGSGLRSRRPPS